MTADLSDLLASGERLRSAGTQLAGITGDVRAALHGTDLSAIPAAFVAVAGSLGHLSRREIEDALSLAALRLTVRERE